MTNCHASFGRFHWFHCNFLFQLYVLFSVRKSGVFVVCAQFRYSKDNLTLHNPARFLGLTSKNRKKKKKKNDYDLIIIFFRISFFLEIKYKVYSIWAGRVSAVSSVLRTLGVIPLPFFFLVWSSTSLSRWRHGVTDFNGVTARTALSTRNHTAIHRNHHCLSVW